MQPPPRWDISTPMGRALNELAAWCWRNRVLGNVGISHTGDGILIDPGAGSSTAADDYPFKAISVPKLDPLDETDPFAIAVDRGHIVGTDGVPFAPSNLREAIVLPALTDDIRIYIELTLDPEDSTILDATIEWTDEESIPASDAGDTGTGLGPAKVRKQLFTINTSETGVQFATVAEHSKTNFALLRYALEYDSDNTTWAVALIAA